MIIKEIHIDGFGIFSDFSLNNFQHGINIVLGNNEAGKSTLLEFLRYTLFGYPGAPDKRRPPQKGGTHGGRIKSILSTGKEVIFERFSGSKSGKINLIYEGISSENQNQWSQLLGNARREIFENVYAFSLDELVNLESLSKSGVEDKIFSVGLGMGNISISDVESNIQKQAEQIYTQRGKIQQIPAILNKMLSKKRQIIEIQNNLPLYEELTRQIKQIESEIIDIEMHLKKNRIEKEKVDNYLKCHESFICIMNIDKELETMPELQDYPAEGTEKLKDHEEEEQRLNETINELKKGNQEEKGIEELRNEINSISFNQKLLENIEKVEYLKTNLELYKQTIVERAETDGKIEDYDNNIKRELNEINSEWTEQNITDFSDDIAHQHKIKKDFKGEFDKIETGRRDLEARLKILQTKESPINAINVFIFISLIFIFCAIPAFYYSLHVLGTVCVIIALLLFFGRKYLLKENLTDKIKEQLSDLTAKEKEVKNAYEEYLENILNIEKTLSIEVVLEIFNTITQLKKNINEREELKRKQEKQRIPFIKKFEDEMKSILEISGMRIAGNNSEILVKEIIQGFDTAKEQSQKKEELQNTLSRKQKDLKRAQEKLKRNEQLLKQLLESIKAKDKDDFRKKHEVNNKVKDLIEKRKNAIVQIDTVVGFNKSGELIDFFRTKNVEDIEKKKSDLTEIINLLDDRQKNKRTELGEKKNEIKRIEGESNLAEIMTELESEKQKLNNAYREWMTAKVALRLLEDVRSNYEKEKQPEVIKNSNKYFSKITGERYKRISVSMDEKEVSVFDAREASKKLEQLSRGTREQLLISLRLGFIEEYERKTEPLPVIIDEVLVNFDPDRAIKTAEVFHEFGKKRQILIFTCHPETVEYFKQKDTNQINIDNTV